jgi:hypothetical protein
VSGHAVDIHTATQRTIAAWILCGADAAERLATAYHYGLVVNDLTDFPARSTLSAAANIAARGDDITLEAVRAQLQADHDLRGPHRAGEELPDLGWLDRLVHHAPLHDPPPIAQWCAEVRRSAMRDAPRFGRPFAEYIGTEEPENNPSDIFDVHGLIVRGEPSLIIGDPKVGKTMLTTDLLLHAAAGRRHWVEVPIYRRLRILFAPREDSEQTTKRRIWQLARGAGIEMWELQDHLVIDGTSPLYFDDAKLTSKLERQLANFDVCVIDSLSTIHNADENSVERMAPIMNRWRDLSLGTRTAFPIVHHFRKRGTDAPSAATGGNVLQRARGSSIIGATTRHAVGVERGPDEHQIVISVESNHEVDTEPFVIRRRSGVDDQGRKYIRHERAGSLVDARASKDSDRIDAATLAVIRRAGPDGIGIGRALRDAAIDKLRNQPGGKGCRPVKVDQAADRLSKAGAIARIGDRWRVA